MDDVMKMLRAVINGQSALKLELLGEIKKVHTKAEEHRKETKGEFAKLNSRIDKLGSALAYLEDDAPTREEHDELEARVSKVESKIASH